jgi:hypothetical protein
LNETTTKSLHFLNFQFIILGEFSPVKKEKRPPVSGFQQERERGVPGKTLNPQNWAHFTTCE